MLRLGVVSFLNARPLIAGLGPDCGVECLFDVPAALPARLDRGEVDAALIPMVDALRGSGRYRLVSDACIGCDGETMTVRVFSQVPPDRVRTLWVDPDSHTSVALARIVWRDLFNCDLDLRAFDPRRDDVSRLESVLLIGDKVVSPRRGSFAYEVDLGGAWRQHTGLPFVFAVWAVNADADLRDVAAGLRAGRDVAAGGPPAASGVDANCPPPCKAGVGGGSGAHRHCDDPAVVPPERGDGADVPAGLGMLLSAARDRGVARAADIAAEDGPPLGWPVEQAQRYLTRCLTYRLDERSIAGANRFARLCAEVGVVPAGSAIVWPEGLVAAEASGAHATPASSR